MTSRVVAKTEIACEYLSRAIELYLRGDSFASALHLAGAAEELFAVLVRAIPDAKGAAGKATLDQMKELIVAVSKPGTSQEAREIEDWAHRRMTDPKNSVKHMYGLRDVGVTLDIREEAYDVIDRAISTYIQLDAKVRLPMVTGISDFDARARTERKQ
jgi:hypothetical protein